MGWIPKKWDMVLYNCETKGLSLVPLNVSTGRGSKWAVLLEVPDLSMEVLRGS